MNYLTGKQLSEKWGIGQCRIIRLAREGRIEGAKKYGKSWLFPENAEKPTDGRTKSAKTEVKAKENYFRFPLYVNSAEESFTPALSGEEKSLRQAEIDFLACDFEKAEKSLKKLSENAENIYVKTMSLFWLCWLSAGCHNGNGYNYYFMNLEQALAKDFPHKREMELLRPWMYINIVQYAKAAEYLDFDTHYIYSPPVLPLMSFLIYADRQSVEHSETLSARADLYEIAVRQFCACGNIYEAQLIHLSLFIFYFTTASRERMVFHLKSALEIAYKYNFIYSVADAYPFYKTAFNGVLNDYPQEFADKIKQCGLKIEKSFSSFTKKNHSGAIFYLLSSNDIKFVLYAMQGYSYKQVAEIVRASERTVANRYAEIYDKLGVDGKQGLLEMMKDSTVKKEFLPLSMQSGR